MCAVAGASVAGWERAVHAWLGARRFHRHRRAAFAALESAASASHAVSTAASTAAIEAAVVQRLASAGDSSRALRAPLSDGGSAANTALSSSPSLSSSASAATTTSAAAAATATATTGAVAALAGGSGGGGGGIGGGSTGVIASPSSSAGLSQGGAAFMRKPSATWGPTSYRDLSTEGAGGAESGAGGSDSETAGERAADTAAAYVYFTVLWRLLDAVPIPVTQSAATVSEQQPNPSSEQQSLLLASSAGPVRSLVLSGSASSDASTSAPSVAPGSTASGATVVAAGATASSILSASPSNVFAASPAANPLGGSGGGVSPLSTNLLVQLEIVLLGEFTDNHPTAFATQTTQTPLKLYVASIHRVTPQVLICFR